jgi:myo-inositol 2-dehydrogenase / D-chiro-inositol 1-dehydrogenase
MDRLATAFRNELEAFTGVVSGELASPCTLADGLAAGWAAEACTVSWRERRPVRVEEVRDA